MDTKLNHVFEKGELDDDSKVFVIFEATRPDGSFRPVYKTESKKSSNRDDFVF